MNNIEIVDLPMEMLDSVLRQLQQTRQEYATDQERYDFYFEAYCDYHHFSMTCKLFRQVSLIKQLDSNHLQYIQSYPKYLAFLHKYPINDSSLLIYSAVLERDLNALKFLTKREDIEVEWRIYDDPGLPQTPISYAVEQGATEIVRLLLQNKQFKRFATENGQSLMQGACQKGFLEIIELFIESKFLTKNIDYDELIQATNIYEGPNKTALIETLHKEKLRQIR